MPILFNVALIVSGSAIYAGEKYYKAHRRKNLEKFLQPPKNHAKNHAKNHGGKLGFDYLRQQQLTEMVKVEDRAHGTTKELEQKVTVSALALGLSTLGALFYTPLSLLSIPVMFYVFSDFLKNAHKSMAKERKLSVDILYVILIPSCTALGFIFTANFQLFILMFNRMLMSRIRDRFENSVMDVSRYQPNRVWLLVDGTEIEVPFETMGIGDTVVVDAGGLIPVDGYVTAGVADVDQQILTGEAQPVDKGVGDPVFASTVVLSGKLYIEVEKTGEETTVAHIGRILYQTLNVKTEGQLGVEERSKQMVVPALVASGLSTPFIGPIGGLGLLLAHPHDKTTTTTSIGILHFLESAAKNGVLTKDGRVFERLNAVDTVVFDKTGTLTEEQPHIGRFHLCSGYEEDDILLYAAMAETKQTDPIARAILQEARVRQLHIPEIDEVAYSLRYGLAVRVGQRSIHVGSVRFIEMEGISIPEEVLQVQDTCHRQGYSLVLVAVNDSIAGAIELHATVRPEACEVIRGLRLRNLNSLYIISADHEQSTEKLAEVVGIDQYFAEVLPENKAKLIKQLQEEGRTVCYVGDGINDAMALEQADVSVSLRGASTVATDTAQIILMDKSLRQLCYLFDLSRDYETNIKTTLRLILFPAVFGVAGPFLLQLGLLPAMIVNQVIFVVAVGNSVWPRMRHRLQAPTTVEDEKPQE